MKNIDIIVDFENSLFPSIPLQVPIKSILFPYWHHRKGNSFWFPIWYYRKLIEDNGINVRFHTFRGLNIEKLTSIIGIDSRVLDIGDNLTRPGWNKNWSENHTLSFLKNLQKKGKRIVWFDTNDSTGSTQFHVLDYVDKYFKRQFIKDKSQYKNNFALGRYFADYYAKKYNLNPDLPIFFAPLKNKEEKKLGLSWNFALNDFRPVRKMGPLTRTSPLKFQKPNLDRKIQISARFSTKYQSELIQFQRVKLLEYVKKGFPPSSIGVGLIPRERYIADLSNSKCCLSPFGWGELCYRDIEAFLTGTALVKPDVSLLETWPDIYRRNETYISIPWDLEEWSGLPNLLSDNKMIYNIASKGQAVLKEVWSKKGVERFVNRFISMWDFN